MITPEDVAAWRSAQVAALKTIDDIDSDATKPYLTATTLHGGADLSAAGPGRACAEVRLLTHLSAWRAVLVQVRAHPGAGVRGAL